MTDSIDSTGVFRLRNVVRPYAWGSTTVIQELLGSPIDGQPAAELWMGAHPSAPSVLRSGGTAGSTAGTTAGGSRTLIDLVAADPTAILGDGIVRRFGPELPFLLKVLAADRPLSIQAHPTLDQARAGYAEENGRGLPRDSPMRNYVDANHKPELISALTDFHALCGFRPVQASADLLTLLIKHGAAELQGFPERIVSDGGLRDVVTTMLTMPTPWQRQLVSAVLGAAVSVAADKQEWSAECGWTIRLSEFYPNDPGVVLALLMNLVVLRPGQALFLSAGRIHAYLYGSGVELMASSDNVLRCGLTAKHVDPPELLRVLDFSTELVEPINPTQDGPWQHYPVPIQDFSLSRLTLSAEPSAQQIALTTAGPQIVLVTQGQVNLREIAAPMSTAGTVVLERGESAFISAGLAVELSGVGQVFQASTNLGS